MTTKKQTAAERLALLRKQAACPHPAYDRAMFPVLVLAGVNWYQDSCLTCQALTWRKGEDA